MLDVRVDAEVKRLGGASDSARSLSAKNDASIKILKARTPEHSDGDSALEEIVGLTIARAEIAKVGDVEAQVENIGTGRSVVHDLNSG